MTEDTIIDQPPYECPECRRSFKTTSALREHSRSHGRAAPEPLPTPRFDTIPEPTEVIVAGTPVQMPTAGTIRTIDWSTETKPTAKGDTPDVVVKVKKLKHYGKLPDIKQATAGSSGFDLYAAIDTEMVIAINHWELIPTGLSIEVPPGWVAKIVPRSGLAANNGITVLNTPGIVDSDYRGEIKINLVNNTTSKFRVQPGMRIAQMLIERSPTVRLEFVTELSDTARGTGGFGSTGHF